MASKYLKEKLSEVNTGLSLVKTLEDLKTKSLKSVLDKLRTGKFLIPRKPLNINIIIAKYKEKFGPREYEINLRREKLAEAEKIKKELEAKLQGLKLSITDLKNTETPLEVKKLNLMSSEVRQEYYETERKKAEENAKLLKKYIKQQKKLEEAIGKNLKHMEKQLTMQKEEEKYDAQYEIFLRNERIKEEREKMLEKKKKRLEFKENLKNSQSQHVLKKPLFQIYEEKFNSEILMPELERRKEELKKKREIFEPIEPIMIKKHSEWYETVKETHRKKFAQSLAEKVKNEKIKEKSLLESAWSARVNEEKKELREKDLKRLQKKRELKEKMKNYAEFAQELYSPSYHTPRVQKSEAKMKKLLKSVNSDCETEEKHWKPKKFKPNSLLPPSKKHIPVKVIDYLAEKRSARKNKPFSPSSVSTTNLITNSSMASLDQIKKNAMKLEELAKKKSLLIKNTPDGNFPLEETRDVDELLINSIRAKLLVLNNLE